MPKSGKPIIEKKRLFDLVQQYRKKMKLPEACEKAGITSNTYYEYKKTLKKAKMLGDAKKPVKRRELPDILPMQSATMKMTLESVEIAFTEIKSFKTKDGVIEFSGSGTIKGVQL